MSARVIISDIAARAPIDGEFAFLTLLALIVFGAASACAIIMQRSR